MLPRRFLLNRRLLVVLVPTLFLSFLVVHYSPRSNGNAPPQWEYPDKITGPVGHFPPAQDRVDASGSEPDTLVAGNPNDGTIDLEVESNGLGNKVDGPLFGYGMDLRLTLSSTKSWYMPETTESSSASASTSIPAEPSSADSTLTESEAAAATATASEAESLPDSNADTSTPPLSDSTSEQAENSSPPVGADSYGEQEVADLLADTPAEKHPIDELIKRGKEEFDQLLAKRSATLEEAAAAYRARRGRHPPPRFDEWWEHAQSKEAVVIEDMFDQIYSDLEPFWGLDPGMMRNLSLEWHSKLTIRNGVVEQHSPDRIIGAWLTDWEYMLRTIEKYLPDVDLAFNNIDESRIIVPWEDIDRYMIEASKHKNTDAPTNEKPLIGEYQSLTPLDPEAIPERREHIWEDWHNNTPHWNFVRAACPPDSEARGSDLIVGNESAPFFPNYTGFPAQSYYGYVSNWTSTRSPCANPILRTLHGTFIKPRWNSVNQTLFPLLGGSKVLGVNNEIIVPAAKYWSAEEDFSGPSSELNIPWDRLLNRSVWRGAASGGDHNKTNWRHFHRHRFMSVLNGTQVTLTERKIAKLGLAAVPHVMSPSYNTNATVEVGEISMTEPFELPHNFPLPDFSMYPLGALQTEPTTLGAWIDTLSDGGFVHFMCHPQYMSQFGKGDDCDYVNDFYTVKDHVKLPDQFAHKFLPDIDGNSYSGRYRAFLRSGSLPMKSTIYTEWHDARLVPWVHFVPMDMSYADYFGIMEYFAGYDQPEKIADPTAEASVPTSDTKAVSESTGQISNSASTPGDTQPDTARRHRKRAQQGSVLADSAGKQKRDEERISIPPHDTEAREIAEAGRDWAAKVLRHEDMLLYFHRVILEYARVSNDKRDDMGWAGDLKG